jgi:hypothetical protein
MKKQLSLFLLLIMIQASVPAQQFKISYSPAAFKKSFTGKKLFWAINLFSLRFIVPLPHELNNSPALIYPS